MNNLLDPTPRLATAAQLNGALSLVFAVTETIREMGSAPAGILYAGLMTRGVSMQDFDKLVGIITGAGLVEKRGDLLVWVGPAVRA